MKVKWSSEDHSGPYELNNIRQEMSIKFFPTFLLLYELSEFTM